MLCATMELLNFRNQAFQKKQLYEELDALVKNLSEQGVWEAILHVDDIDRLNQKMKEFIPQFNSPLTCETGKEFCRNVLVSLVLEKVYEEKGAEASDDEIKAAVKQFVQNPDWVKVFDELLTEVSELEKYEYLIPLNAPGLLASIPESEQQNLLQLLQSVFVLGRLNQARNNSTMDYAPYMRNLTLFGGSFEDEFKETANEYFAKHTGLQRGNPFFKTKKLQLNINYSKLITKRIVDILDWESKEISTDAINAKYGEMCEKRPQYLMLVYVSLMMKGDAALQPIL